MLALLIEGVTLTRKDLILAQVPFRGGATRTLEITVALNAYELSMSSRNAIRRKTREVSPRSPESRASARRA
jgi:hypothetical protein